MTVILEGREYYIQLDRYRDSNRTALVLTNREGVAMITLTSNPKNPSIHLDSGEFYACPYKGVREAAFKTGLFVDTGKKIINQYHEEIPIWRFR